MLGPSTYAEFAYAEPEVYGLIQTDVQALAGEALVELFTLDATAIGGTLSRFHAGTNQLKTSVIWQGNAYPAMPIEVTGFEFTGKGKLPRPTMRVQNIDGLIGAVADAYEDLIGAVIMRQRTFVKYLDAVNFPGGTNPTADPTAAFPDDVYAINRKVVHTKAMIEFELASAFDIHGVQLPRRQIIQHTCLWQYRSAECSYVGGPVATVDDVQTSESSLDVCGKRIKSCTLRFGAHGVLPFGGFPGTGVIFR